MIYASDENERVNHPRHYNKHPAEIECIEVVEHMTFNVGSAIKYLWRNGLKDIIGDSKAAQIEDLKKAIFYIEREIQLIENDKH
jgi:hypothetical protein